MHWREEAGSSCWRMDWDGDYRNKEGEKKQILTEKIDGKSNRSFLSSFAVFVV